MSNSGYRNALPAGTRLHWYTLDSVLGQGGFGITYLALDTNLDHPVAIKEYLPVEISTRGAKGGVHPLSDAHREAFAWGLERFVSEARTLARFDHPSVVRVLSVFELNGTAYMVMRYEDGRSLQSLLPPGAVLDPAWVERMLIRIVGGLARIHAAGFIHRDIKPANIYIRRDDAPVLLDFGSARQSLGQATRTLTTLVSPGFAPFEQYAGRSDTQGPWTDIYALGATAYRALAGAAPVDALERSEALLGEGRDPYRPLAERCAGLGHPELLAAVDHALAFRDTDRPRTLAEWLAEIRPRDGARTARGRPPPPAAQLAGAAAAARSLPVGRAEGTATARTDTEGRSSAPCEPDPPTVVAPPRRRWRRRWLAAAAVALAAVGLLAVVSGDPPAEATGLDPPSPGGPADEVHAALEAAAADLRALRLAGPDGDNAYARYRAVLDREPDNRAARAGLRTLIEYHAERARRAAELGDRASARADLEVAYAMAPSPEAERRVERLARRLGLD